MYIGDVQSFKLLENFHLNDQLNHISESETVKDFLHIVKKRIENEEELVIDPEFFYSLPSLNKRISRVEVKLRRGESLNETTQYHFDVFIYTKQKFQTTSNFIELFWGKDIFDFESIRSIIGNNSADIIYIYDIPNKRISLNIKKERVIRKLDDSALLSDCLYAISDDVNSVNPEELWNLSEINNCKVELVISGNSDQNNFDAIIIKNKQVDGYHIRNSNLQFNSIDSLSNKPLNNIYKHEITEKIKKELRENLPDYMIPSLIIPVEKFPLTPNNKIDKKALADRDITGIVSNTSSAKAETEIQKILVEIWENLLGISGIGIDDNFFELGGHSILAAQMLADFEKTTGHKIPLAELFTAQTIRQLSGLVEHVKPKLNWNTLVEIKKGNNKLPLFLIHGAEGNVLLYKDLAKHLHYDQPVYGLQARGLNGEDHIHRSIKEMAADYIKAIKSVQPKGPYNIGGYCMGGTVAFEIAQKFRSSGEV
ncbi:MAG: thioesterase domain-containing protein, partial [Ignavibacterium sp.]